MLTILQTIKQRHQVWQARYSPVCKVHISSSTYRWASSGCSIPASMPAAALSANCSIPHMPVLLAQKRQVSHW